MHLHRPTKIIFFILALLAVLACIFIAIQYPHLKQASGNSALTGQPQGTCAPNSTACQGNPKLCLDLNKNLVCN